ncbi:MAG: glycosyltransferase family 2 protein, partial [Cyanobacteria bacterium J06635_1]
MPCLNEAETLGICIHKAATYLRKYAVRGEIVIADNGSTDGSRDIAQNLGARVIDAAEKGYGSALMAGINAARGEYIVMGDADDSYDFSDLTLFLRELRGGYDLVMGNRFRGGIQPGAMPWLNRYLGNPVLTGIGKLFFPNPCGDFHCGLRGFDKAAIESLNLRTTGMEFASEMVVKATLGRLRITEVPTTLAPDGRSRPPHLKRWEDGWRHLRFLLLYSPRWLFLYPGLFLMGCGLLAGLLLISGPRGIFDIHTLLFSATGIIVGLQSCLFALFTKLFAISEGLLPDRHHLVRRMRALSLEKGLILGSVFWVMGCILTLNTLNLWKGSGFGQLDPTVVMRIAIPAATLLICGSQIILASFF